MVPRVRRRWRTSFGADAPLAGAVIVDAEENRRPLTRRPRPIPSHTRACQKESGRGVARARLLIGDYYDCIGGVGIDRVRLAMALPIKITASCEAGPGGCHSSN